jgi:TRAP-type C4-dicarboxylate transport system permease small subunit
MIGLAMRRAFESVIAAWSVIQRYAAAIVMIVMTALYAFNVLVRALVPQFAASLAWIDEGARYMMVWVVFLAAGVALETGRHVLIDLLWHRWSDRTRRAVFALIDVVGLAFSIFMVVLAIQLTLFIARSGQISPTLGIPAYVLYVAPAVGFSSLALLYLARLFGLRDARRKPVVAEWLGTGGSS